ncbi:D-alanyl-D-alanine carboxypeptidase family protein [Cyanobium sp. WAJ14-Wanaka]|uniref:M15 family metallopeptidase n=1 Tax=Cyanobium sp. WAJ14-Wanaka TaxID=2823725 RepID=UPI0020CDFAA5|nr:M15 family metallopeptidase [Cyanobium sp. WAJ14-Wanaka]
MNGAKRGRAAQQGVDDIPVAHRSTPKSSSRASGFSPLANAVAAMVVVLTALALIFPQPLRRLLGPPPIQGLNARPGIDGRLLGHFPYGEIRSRELTPIAPGIELQRDAAESFAAMQAAAAAEGMDLVVLSGYRSTSLQKHLFFDVKAERNQTARERALVSAPPGYSEHATGFALDIGDGNAAGTNLSQSFDQTAAFAWLQANAARYQFALSFPRSNAQGVNYEPWHWRYEGSTDALKVFEPAQRLAK